MEYEHIDNIQRDDLIAFYKRYFFPSNMILAVQGDFHCRMRAKLEKYIRRMEVQAGTRAAVSACGRESRSRRLPRSQAGRDADLVCPGPSWRRDEAIRISRLCR